MKLKEIHSYFPFPRILKLTLGLALSVQFIIITFNHFSGFYPLAGIDEFTIRLLSSSTLSFISGILLAYPDLGIIISLNRRLPWGKATFTRTVLEFLFAVLYAAILGGLFTLVSNAFGLYRDEFRHILMVNIVIFAVFNTLLVILFEGWLFFIYTKQAEQKEAKLKQELTQIKFEALKSQINPHFIFNSLNVLSGLIQTDTDKAQEFIDEFSHIYRYVLETVEKPVVTLEKELEFMRSYLFLQQIRYGKSLTYSVNIPAEHLETLMPPLSMQVVLENAMKHNIVNEEYPLLLEISVEENSLIIRNRLQPKLSAVKSTGVGLKNLKKRYALVSGRKPLFSIETHFYIAKLPLIKAE